MDKDYSGSQNYQNYPNYPNYDDEKGGRKRSTEDSATEDTSRMLDLFTITQRIDCWVMKLLKEGWPENKKVNRKAPKSLLGLKEMLAKAKNEGAEDIHQKLREMDWHVLLLELLFEELPPPKNLWDELTYVLFKSCAVFDPDDKCYYHGFGIDGTPMHGLVFLREIMGRLNLIAMYDHLDEPPEEEDGGALKRRQMKCWIEPTKLPLELFSRFGTKCGVTTLYGNWLEEWHATGIWTETCEFEIYRQYMASCYSKKCTSLIELSALNIEELKIEALDHAKTYPVVKKVKDEEKPNPYGMTVLEEKIAKRFLSGKLFFKHATYNAQVFLKSEIMLCPDLSSSEGVSDRNKKFGHNKYVFGRMEFTDEYWDTRFGDERIMFEIGSLGDAISISLHDQAQPFSTGRRVGQLRDEKNDEWPGHTQLIEDQQLGVCFRYIGGPRNQQSWTQFYTFIREGTKLGEAALQLLRSNLNWKPLQYKNSFVQEIFVGQKSCRMGLANSFIRELRRIKRAVDELSNKAREAKSLSGVDGKAVEELEKYAANAQSAYQRLMDSIENALENPKLFQNIFKQFFRVEIRVPAYIILTDINEFRCVVKTKGKATKQFTQIQFKEFDMPVSHGMECSIVHKILVECRSCVALLQRFKQKTLTELAVPFLQAVCATFDEDKKDKDAPWKGDVATTLGNSKLKVEGRSEIEGVLVLINELMNYHHEKLGFQQCFACGTCSSFGEAVGMLNVPGKCTKCGQQALVCWNPHLNEHALGFSKLFRDLAALIQQLLQRKLL